MAYFMKDEFPDVDINKVILMCMMHDFGEAFTGDIPAFDKTSDDENTEENVIKEWIDSLPEPYRTELAELFAESQVETVSKAKQGGIMSVEASVDELYGDTKDDDWKQEEVARLKAEQGISDMEEPALNTELDGFEVESF